MLFISTKLQCIFGQNHTWLHNWTICDSNSYWWNPVWRFSWKNTSSILEGLPLLFMTACSVSMMAPLFTIHTKSIIGWTAIFLDTDQPWRGLIIWSLHSPALNPLYHILRGCSKEYIYDAAIDDCCNLISDILWTYGDNLDYHFMSGTFDITS
jgi:hypothetical protein